MPIDFAQQIEPILCKQVCILRIFYINILKHSFHIYEPYDILLE